MFQEYPDVLSVADLCRMLNIGKSTTYALLRNNVILHVRVGRKYIIPKTSVIGFLSASRYNGNG